VNWLYYVPHSLSWKMRFFFQTAFPLWSFMTKNNNG
jgi:hypothetical protein